MWTSFLDNNIFHNQYGHLLLLALPVLMYLMFFIARKKLRAYANYNKDIFAAYLSLFFFVPSIYLYLSDIVYSSELFSFSQIFSHLNIFLSMLIGLGLIFKKYSLIQITVPAAIVFGIAPLVNDPQGNLSVVNSLNDISLATAPILVIFITKSNLIIKGQLTSMFVSLFILMALFTNQDMMSKHINVESGYSKNSTFYWFKVIGPSEALIIMAAMLMLQVLTFIIIRFIFTKTKQNFFRNVKTEVVLERRNFAKKFSTEIELEILFFEELVSMCEASEVEEGTKIVELKETVVLEVPEKLTPVSTVRTLNSIGARAPSF